MSSRPAMSPAPPPKPVKRVNSGGRKTPLMPMRSPPPVPRFNFDVKPRRRDSSEDSSGHPVAPPRIVPRKSQATDDDDSFYRKVMASVNRFQLDGKFCDVAIVYEEQQFPAHEIVLAANSGYFEEVLLRPGYREQERREIVVKDVDKNSMAACIGYMYTNTLEVTMENVALLLASSTLLKIEGILSLCWKYLSRSIRGDTCVQIEKLAKEYNNPNLVASAMICFQQNFVDASRTNDFKELSLDDVTEKLKSNGLEVASEEVVYEAAIDWLKHHIGIRKRFVVDILRCVRLPLLSASFLAQTVRKEPLIKGFDECRDMLEDAFTSLLTEERTTKPRKQPRKDEFVIYVLNTKDMNLHTYQPASGNWSSRVESPLGHCERTLVTRRKEIYAVGGSGNSFVQKMDAGAGSSAWSQVPNDININTIGLAAVVVGDNLYVSGGETWPLTLCSMHRYDIPNSTWIAESPMQKSRAHHVMTVAEGFIYVAGGSTGENIHDSAERFDIVNKVWSNIAPMKEKRAGAAAVTVHTKIYVLGGHDGFSPLSSVETYDTTNLSWTTSCAMRIPRSRFGACLENEDIYAIGGNEESTVGIFSTIKCEWRELQTDKDLSQVSLTSVLRTER